MREDSSALAKKTAMGDPRQHYVELDALRGIAILCVVMFHTAGYWTSTGVTLTTPRLGMDVVMNLLFFGTYGVSLFFLLSGYLLTWTEEKRARSGIYTLRSYTLRRTLRIVPAYYVAIAIVVVLWPLNASAIDVLMHASFLHSFTPQTNVSLDAVWWSLTPEVVFYCLLPLIILKLPRVSQRLALFGVFALISLALRLYAYETEIVPDPTTPPSFSFSYVLGIATSFLYIFLAGVLLRMLVEYLNSRPESRLRLWLAWPATILFLIGSVSIVALAHQGMKHPILAAAQGEVPWLLPALGLPFELIVIAFFAAGVLGSPLLRTVLKWRPLAFTGRISYSMFLLHHTVLVMVATPYLVPTLRDWLANQNSLLAVWAAFSGYVLVILTIAFTISYLSYRYIEIPFLSYKPK
jgi:peptidoglycan/LPS O-acetylase OafA/YrhL